MTVQMASLPVSPAKGDSLVPPPFPLVVDVKVGAVPQWLKAIPQWVSWALLPKFENGEWRFTKPPVRANSQGFGAAKTNDPTGWCDYTTACAFLKEYNGTLIQMWRQPYPARISGIGIVLTSDLGIVGVDFDHARGDDGNPLEWSAPLLEALFKAGAYVEVSPSGHGYRAFLRGSLPSGRAGKGNNVEVYSTGRYLTITGHQVSPDSKLPFGRDVDLLIKSLWDYAKRRKGAAPKPAEVQQVVEAAMSDDELLSRMCAKNEKARGLFYEGHSAGIEDKSSNDQSLCNSVTFYFGPDMGRIDRIMRRSALLSDPERLRKWDSPHRDDGATYGQMTIESALETSTHGFYLDHRREIAAHLSGEKGSAETPELPVIEYNGGDLLKTVRDVEKAIAGKVYAFANTLVRLIPSPPITTADRSNKWRRRATGQLIVSPLDADSLMNVVADCTIGIKWNERGETWKRCYPEKQVIKGVLAHKGEWNVPVLCGITACPLFRLTEGEEKGYSILSAPGFDRATGMYCDFSAEEFPLADFKDSVTDEGLTHARETLLDALSEFPFVDDTDRAVAVSGMLSVVVRPLIKNAPLIAITAPTAGTGKSSLAMIYQIMATGKNSVSGIAYTGDENELEKRVFSTLMETSPVTVLDNLPNGGQLHSETLDRVLTDPVFKSRILGTHDTATVSTITLWVSTGNNTRIVNDSSRRTLLCELDRKEERPADHPFKRNIEKWALENRGELVRSALVILAGYVRAGMPVPKGWRTLGSFDEWSDLVRGATLWMLTGGKSKSADYDSVKALDPVFSQRKIEDTDPVRNTTLLVLSAIWDVFGDRLVTAADIANAGIGVAVSKEQSALYEALIDAINSPAGVNAKTVGRWLSRNSKAVVGGYSIRPAAGHASKTFWKMTKA